MEKHPRGAGDRADLGERLEDTDLVVGGHDRNEHGRSVTAARFVETDKPSRSTPSQVTRQPSRSSLLNESSTELCSVATVMT